jgi:hypothetical protein
MASTVEILGVFFLIFSVFNAILGVMLLHLSLLRTKSKKLVTWIYTHGGFTSLNAMRAHYSKGGMPISHRDIVSVIEDVTELDKSDWSKEPSLLTENDVVNEKNMSVVIQNKNQLRGEAIKRKQVSGLYKERNVLDSAIQRCYVDYSGQIICPK